MAVAAFIKGDRTEAAKIGSDASNRSRLGRQSRRSRVDGLIDRADCQSRRYPISGRSTLPLQTPKMGVVRGNSARRDLCGGLSVVCSHCDTVNLLTSRHACQVEVHDLGAPISPCLSWCSISMSASAVMSASSNAPCRSSLSLLSSTRRSHIEVCDLLAPGKSCANRTCVQMYRSSA